jgi:hypothetical protein
MKLRIALTSSLALALAVFAVLGHRASAGGRQATLRATLRGLNQAPPVKTAATGTLRATYDEARQTITFALDYRNLTTNPTGAHIHFGPTKVNGGVIAFFCGGGNQPACPATTSGRITGTITVANIVAVPAQGITDGDFVGLSLAIRTANAYVNVHNDTFAEGEIRGQIEGLSSGRAEDQDGSDD